VAKALDVYEVRVFVDRATGRQILAHYPLPLEDGTVTKDPVFKSMMQVPTPRGTAQVTFDVDGMGISEAFANLEAGAKRATEALVKDMEKEKSKIVVPSMDPSKMMRLVKGGKK
jgi:hypothetical protein